MKRQFVMVVAIGISILTVGCGAASKSAPKKPEPAPAVATTEIKALGKAPISYLSATSSLDRFLGAWLSGDVSLAKAFLTPSQRNLLDGAQARATFLGEDGGKPEAFELIGARQASASEYQFKVWT